MTIKRKFKSKFKLALRRVGLLCKQPVETTRRIRISHTRNPDGSITQHGKLTEQPMVQGSTYESELHIWREIHKITQTPNK
jgi:hypothetical protein